MTDTKDDLQKKVEELERQVAEQKQLLDVQAENLRKLVAKGEGWLVTTPNPVYDGQVYGIQFVNGQAFIRKGQHIQYFEHPPAKETTFTKMGYKPEQIAAIREREKIPSAERAVEALKNEFGYIVEWFSADRLIELQGRIDARLTQRVQAEEIQQQQALANQLVAPQFYNR